MKLLLVEDEIQLQGILAKGLKKCGYAVDTAGDGEEALELFEVNEYDLIILDLSLPKIDGLEVLKNIRKSNHTIKILILSARSDTEDRITGLDRGANDYLVKPFDYDELKARIRCLLRQQVVMQETELTVAGITINLARYTVKIGDEVLPLTKKEFSILEYLMLNKNKVISAEQIIEHVWDSEADLFSQSFKFHISSLKKKIAEKYPEEVIRNVRGQGYIIIEDKAVI
jgi:DNA-binding response OmpR family regulator